MGEIEPHTNGEEKDIVLLGELLNCSLRVNRKCTQADLTNIVAIFPNRYLIYRCYIYNDSWVRQIQSVT